MSDTIPYDMSLATSSILGTKLNCEFSKIFPLVYVSGDSTEKGERLKKSL